MVTWFRHQLAAYSPIPTGAVIGAALSALGDSRSALSELLARNYEVHTGIGAGAVILTGSGTMALRVGIMASLAPSPSDATVALPAFSCFDVASAAVGANARIALYDVDPNTLAPDPDSLRRALKAGAKVLVVAPLYGVPVPWREIQPLEREYGVTVIEDAAQGHRAFWKGHRLGSLGRISVLSFGRGKGWTGGNGGALLLRNATINAPLLRDPGLAQEAATNAGLLAQRLLGHPHIYGLPRAIPALALGQTVYRAPTPPVGMTRAASAALLASWDLAELEAAKRKQNAAELLALIANRSELRPISVHPAAVAGYLRLPLRVTGRGQNWALPERAHRLGVERSYPMPLSRLPAVASRLVNPNEPLPGAEALVRELVTVPTHSLVSKRERLEAIEILSGS